MYAIAMADYDQDKLEGCRSVLKTKDGINRLALYHSSVGRLLAVISVSHLNCFPALLLICSFSLSLFFELHSASV